MTGKIDPVPTSVSPELAEAERRMMALLRAAIPPFVELASSMDEYNRLRIAAGADPGHVTAPMKRMADLKEAMQAGRRPSHHEMEGLIHALAGEHIPLVMSQFDEDEVNRWIQFEVLTDSVVRAFLARDASATPMQADSGVAEA